MLDWSVIFYSTMPMIVKSNDQYVWKKQKHEKLIRRSGSVAHVISLFLHNLKLDPIRCTSRSAGGYSVGDRYVAED